LFEPGGPTTRPAGYEKPKKKRLLQRKAPELTEEERMIRAAERDAREKEKNAKVKSALRITDSDDEDDEERDAAFFALEEQRRKKISGVIRNALLTEVDESAGVKGKRKAKATKEKATKGKKRKTITIESDQESDIDEDEEMRDVGTVDLVSDAEDAADDTPMDAPSPAKNGAVAALVDDDDEEDIVQARPARARANARLPFLDDSDSD